MSHRSIFAAVLLAQLVTPLISGASLVTSDVHNNQAQINKRSQDGYVLQQDTQVKIFDLDSDHVEENFKDSAQQPELNINDSIANLDKLGAGVEPNSTVLLPANTRFTVKDGIEDPQDGKRFIQVALDSGYQFWTDLKSFDSVNYVAEGQFAGSGAGTITSRAGWRIHPTLGYRKCHEGTDIAYPSGTSIGARVGDGKVVQAGSMGGYGKCVTVHHSDGTMSRYGHLSSIAVRVGQAISSGTNIGRSGCTGRCTGPHLHFEHKKIGTSVCGGGGGGRKHSHKVRSRR